MKPQRINQPINLDAKLADIGCRRRRDREVKIFNPTHQVLRRVLIRFAVIQFCKQCAPLKIELRNCAALVVACVRHPANAAQTLGAVKWNISV